MRTVDVGGRTVVSVSGEIDLATLPKLHDALTRAVLAAPGATVAADLDGVTVCDDAGLGILLGGAGRARQRGGDLVVVCSPGPLRERLQRTGFDRALTVAPTVADAFG